MDDVSRPEVGETAYGNLRKTQSSGNWPFPASPVVYVLQCRAVRPLRLLVTPSGRFGRVYAAAERACCAIVAARPTFLCRTAVKT